MENKMEMGGEGNPEKRLFYIKNWEKLITPFINIDNAVDKVDFSVKIAGFLDASNDRILQVIRLSDKNAAVFSEMIKEIRKMLNEKKISKDAPWFETLEKKMIILELFDAGH